MSTGYERDLLTFKLDDPKKGSFRSRAIEVSLWVSISQFILTNYSEPKEENEEWLGVLGGKRKKL